MFLFLQRERHNGDKIQVNGRSAPRRLRDLGAVVFPHVLQLWDLGAQQRTTVVCVNITVIKIGVERGLVVVMGVVVSHGS